MPSMIPKPNLDHIQFDDPVEALAWLHEQFRKYTVNEIPWWEVGASLKKSEELIAQFKPKDETSDDQ